MKQRSQRGKKMAVSIRRPLFDQADKLANELHNRQLLDQLNLAYVDAPLLRKEGSPELNGNRSVGAKQRAHRRSNPYMSPLLCPYKNHDFPPKLGEPERTTPYAPISPADCGRRVVIQWRIQLTTRITIASILYFSKVSFDLGQYKV